MSTVPGAEATGQDRLRVLQVCTNDLGGGAALSAWNLHRAYRRMNVAAWLAVGRKRSVDPDVVEIPRIATGNRWTRAFRGLQGTGPNRAPQLVRRALGLVAWLGEPRRFVTQRLLGAEDYDFPGTRHLLGLPPRTPTLLHLHNLHGGYFDLRLLPRFSRTVPTILNLRDEWPITGHCAYTVGCGRWTGGCGRCPDLTVYPAIERDSTAFNWRRKARIFARSRLYVTTPSRWLMQRVEASMLTAVDRRVIPNGIDLEAFSPGDRRQARARLELPPDATIILTSAHSSFKDRTLAEETMARVSQPRAGASLLFLVLGPVEAARSHGSGTIRYAGYVSSPDAVADHMRAADVYLHTAKAEAFGKTIVEAMACATPVVAADVDAVPEVIEDGRTGIVVSSRDPGDLASAVSRLLNDGSYAAALGSHGRAAAVDRFGLDRQARSFLSWYAEVLDDWTRWRGTRPATTRP
jgi:glycosyltransferase involved in cell wall biosynthesis